MSKPKRPVNSVFELAQPRPVKTDQAKRRVQPHAGDGGRGDTIEHWIENDLKLYVGQRHALPVWRAFATYRRNGMPVPERVLAVFEKWAKLMLELYARGPEGPHSPSSAIGAVERSLGQKLPKNEGKAILQLLQFAGTKGQHKSFGNLRKLEERRRLAAEVRHLYEWRGENDECLSWSEIAVHKNLSGRVKSVQEAKDLLDEFYPTKQKRSSKRIKK